MAARKKRNNQEQPEVVQQNLTVVAKTENQKKVFKLFNDNHLILSGAAGTGKTFLSLYLAYRAMCAGRFDKIIIARSIVPTRDIGFLKGGIELGGDGGKFEPYVEPYVNTFNKFGHMIWEKYYNKKIFFVSTSFLRGLTFDNAVVLVDEFQNCTFHEADTLITRLGENSKLILSGDFFQSDLKDRDKTGIQNFIKIVEELEGFARIDFTFDDVVRSGLVKDYLRKKWELGF